MVENRTGAAGTIGIDAVAKSAPDGYTLGLVLNGNLVINPFVQKSMPFDPKRMVYGGFNVLVDLTPPKRRAVKKAR